MGVFGAMTDQGFPPPRAVLFDKDGTLFDFSASWNSWAASALAHLSAGDAGLRDALARAIGFDLAQEVFLPDSPAIAGTLYDTAARLVPHLRDQSQASIAQTLNDLAREAQMVQAVALDPLMGRLRSAGYVLGLATNGLYAEARKHLTEARIDHHFAYVAGADSGHGAKPDAGMCLAFCTQTGIAAQAVVMVGDSLHDLIAARRAGMRAVAVLTGIADAPSLAPHADAVLPDIGHLPQWLAENGGTRA